MSSTTTSAPSPSRDTAVFHNKNYTPIHPDIFQFDEKFLVKSFVDAVKEAKELKPLMKEIYSHPHTCEQFAGNEEEHKKLHQQFGEYNLKRRTLLAKILELELQDVYSLDVFTAEFCQKLIDEVRNYEKTTEVKLRPNSMNSYGIVIDEMGLGAFFDVFITQYFTHIASVMNKGAFEIDDHHTFVVEYAIAKDKNLDVHVDDSELTLNTCLGLTGFKGGNVFFKGHRDKPTTYNNYGEYENIIGRTILHDGLHMHGALNITEGERYNLIIWCRSSKYRQAMGISSTKL